MAESLYVLAYDIGTTGNKTCLYEISESIRLVESALEGYDLFFEDNGGAEQDPDQWWAAMANTTKAILKKSKISPADIKGISFCSQMQGLVLVDERGKALRRAMSYMDNRAGQQKKDQVGHGIQIEGINIITLLKSLHRSKAAAASTKDPVWKYRWVMEKEPEIFARVHKWLDVKEYLIARCTDKFIMTPDSAFTTFLYDTRKGKQCWSKTLCKLYGVNMDHLPVLVEPTDMVGGLTERAAEELGLDIGTPVFGGGGDASLIGVGAGSVNVGDTHIYAGTSGWVSTLVDKQYLDLNSMIAAVPASQPSLFNYFGEQETSGKCLEWVKDHLALDEIDCYLEKKKITEGSEAVTTSMYDFMVDTSIDVTRPGADGVLFTPWLHGNRCPFEDSYSRGIFFNIGLDTGKRNMIRAVVEGICFHKRWILEASEKKVKTSSAVRFVGGGAISPTICQILADITGRTVETVNNPQNVGAVGVAVLVGIGLGKINSYGEAKKFIPVTGTFLPRTEYKKVYDKSFKVFKRLYTDNKRNFLALNKLSTSCE